MKKEDLIAELRRRGEEAPPRWNKMEIRSRIEELAEVENEPLPTRQDAPHTESQKNLGTASRKKSELVKFCLEKLNMTLTGNETMGQLQSQAIRRIHAITEPSEHDTLNLGSTAPSSTWFARSSIRTTVRG